MHGVASSAAASIVGVSGLNMVSLALFIFLFFPLSRTRARVPPFGDSYSRGAIVAPITAKILAKLAVHSCFERPNFLNMDEANDCLKPFRHFTKLSCMGGGRCLLLLYQVPGMKLKPEPSPGESSSCPRGCRAKTTKHTTLLSGRDAVHRAAFAAFDTAYHLRYICTTTTEVPYL